ncbi:hypothetical protein FOC4_g10013296 [Fusarium odoratissimum]|uniref:Uncharacterized protein n=1 Tax=Fusarium oxysporum f. sp. cubense (strain race 4) TaxID=2502994 RepID=N1RFA9_FUSC4|nr:hypothetical protein FOC4_g10013296 [Fusarium odoratissimum]
MDDINIPTLSVNDETLDPYSLENSNNLADRLRSSSIECADYYQTFLPFLTLSRILNKACIEAHLKKEYGDLASQYADHIGPLYADEADAYKEMPFQMPSDNIPVFHHVFHRRTILPWCRLNGSEVGLKKFGRHITQGGYSTIQPIKIDKSSHEFEKVLRGVVSLRTVLNSTMKLKGFNDSMVSAIGISFNFWRPLSYMTDIT